MYVFPNRLRRLFTSVFVTFPLLILPAASFAPGGMFLGFTGRRPGTAMPVFFVSDPGMVLPFLALAWAAAGSPFNWFWPPAVGRPPVTRPVTLGLRLAAPAG